MGGRKASIAGKAGARLRWHSFKSPQCADVRGESGFDSRHLASDNPVSNPRIGRSRAPNIGGVPAPTRWKGVPP